MMNNKFGLGIAVGVEAVVISINWFFMKRKIKKEIENIKFEDIQEEVEKELENMFK